jgi:translation elongation factor EF-1beta
MSGIPAVAITSDNLTELTSEITHTEKDTIQIVDYSLVEELAYGLKALFEEVTRQ